MRFDRLRMVGFKSFCESTDVVIEPGLTGVVGPNGCGKSNLVEAMRWVMGESSFKNMRASGMDDVIFSGSGNRPSRNTAEVSLLLDNSDRSAPVGFNDSETIEVARRIERDAGSTYRINGREVRARDVQLLFADASSGSRSPAMVRQGQIGEIVSAKPQQRRRILEEAAGIAGLHSRRHEAELRLKAADDNLGRLKIVLTELDSQIDGLKRQARQATRYKKLAAEIRRNQALVYYLAHRDLTLELAETERRAEADTRNVAERTRAQGEAARLQAIAAAHLPELRENEAKSGAALQRLIQARDQLDAEERRTKERATTLERRAGELARDLQREASIDQDAADVMGKLATEAGELEMAGESAQDAEYSAKERLAEAQGRLEKAEAELGEAQAALADANARRSALERSLNEETQRLRRAEAEIAKVAQEIDTLEASAGTDEELAILAGALSQAIEAAGEAEAATLAAEAAHRTAQGEEFSTRAPHTEAERKAQRLETEVATLAKLLAAGEGDLWPPVVDAISVTKGYEAALGAALGDDLEASTNVSAPAHWALADASSDDPALPPGVQSLREFVEAPDALARRLGQIGVVLRGEGAHLRGLLKVGQRLVSKEGDLWRWDGFTAAAEAPTPAARRLAEKNRLGDLRIDAEAARQVANTAKAASDTAQTQLREAAATETSSRQRARETARAVEAARERNSAAERRRQQVAQRLSALAEAATRLQVNLTEAKAKTSEAQSALAGMTATASLSARLDRARALAAEERVLTAEARTALQTLVREAEIRTRRRAAVEAERLSWEDRRRRAHTQIGELELRIGEAREELEKLAESPGQFLLQRRALFNEIEQAETARKEQSDKRVEAENALAGADKLARDALDAMAGAREERARNEARVESLRLRHAEIVRAIAADLDCEPSAVAALAGVEDGAELPDAQSVGQALEGLRTDRDKLGAVNLRADDELVEVEKKRDELLAENDDLTEAVRKLRLAIGNLNKEGRERLVAAFDVVNGHFKELFTSLFGGGAAELTLVESEDPLEAGLEIIARPPGKKPQTLTLLSGGEQALTAMSLIFAVFLTNPSPICVMDEVDAPLDDANVERFCDLLEEMRKKTDTRFITITHNPITMARMDRLYGVTMAERGVSQLVSVDLQEAARFLEAV